MTPQRIDHVALWVADREADTRRILDLFDIDVLEKTDDFTLIGSDPELGKLTLFDAEGPRAQSQLMGIAFREPGREDAQDIDVGEGLHLYRLGMPHAWAVDLDHVSVAVDQGACGVPRWSPHNAVTVAVEANRKPSPAGQAGGARADDGFAHAWVSPKGRPQDRGQVLTESCDGRRATR